MPCRTRDEQDHALAAALRLTSSLSRRLNPALASVHDDRSFRPDVSCSLIVMRARARRSIDPRTVARCRARSTARPSSRGAVGRWSLPWSCERDRGSGSLRDRSEVLSPRAGGLRSRHRTTNDLQRTQRLACPVPQSRETGHMANIKSQKNRTRQNERRTSAQPVRTRASRRGSSSPYGDRHRRHDADALVQAAQKRS